MTPNQVVAYNVAKARALRGWTQREAAEHLARYWGARLSGASFSALERSAWNSQRIRQFNADELFALARGFNLPIGFFLTPPPSGFDAAVHAPDAPASGVDPIVLLDAVLGTPENLVDWEVELLAYSAGHVPAPGPKTAVVPIGASDISDRLQPLETLHSQALLRGAFGDLADASDVLRRVASALQTLDDIVPDGAAPSGSSKHGKRSTGAQRQQADRVRDQTLRRAGRPTRSSTEARQA